MAAKKKIEHHERLGVKNLNGIPVPGEYYRIIGKELARIRLEEGIFAEKVAETAGISRVWLSQLENYKVKQAINLDTVGRIAGVLGYRMNISFEKIK